jgi:hypothetical protein
MRPYDAMAVENRVRPGTPDVNYIGGWVELKWLRRWPKNSEEAPVKIEHFTPQQRVWLKTRWMRGGRAFLLLQAGGTDWLLFDGVTAAYAVGRVPRSKLYAYALATWKTLNEQELREWLTTDLKRLPRQRQFLSTAYDESIPSDRPQSD